MLRGRAPGSADPIGIGQQPKIEPGELRGAQQWLGESQAPKRGD